MIDCIGSALCYIFIFDPRFYLLITGRLLEVGIEEFVNGGKIVDFEKIILSLYLQQVIFFVVEFLFALVAYVFINLV